MLTFLQNQCLIHIYSDEMQYNKTTLIGMNINCSKGKESYKVKVQSLIGETLSVKEAEKRPTSR